jgi:hypothetical protein
LADYATSELGVPVMPMAIDLSQFTGPHLTDSPDLAAVLAASAAIALMRALHGGGGDPFRAGEQASCKFTSNEVLEAGRAAVEAIGFEHTIDDGTTGDGTETGGRTFSGWTRSASGDACPACEGLADGSVLSWGTPMWNHPSCSCVQVPEIEGA